MKLSPIVGMCAMFLGLFGCAVDSADAPAGTTDDALRRTSGKELTCEAGRDRLALVAIANGKYALVSFERDGDLYAMNGINGALTTTSTRWSWSGGRSSLTLDADLKGTWERNGRSKRVTCEKSTVGDVASFRTANALTDYASEIDGLADAVLESSEESEHPKSFTVYAVESSRRDSLALGDKVRNSQGALPGEDAESTIDDDESGYGGISAAYSLGGGDDYGEWFQGASDGISLSGTVTASLKSGTRAGFIARENVTALASHVDSSKPSAVEISVGDWTFFVPGAFPK